jgi:hypothetical protein
MQKDSMTPGSRPVQPGNRELVAFPVAPLIVPFVYLLPFPGKAHIGEGAMQVSPLDALITTWLFAIVSMLPFAYLAEAVLGVPAWLLFKAYGLRSIGSFIVGGGVIGVFVYVGFVSYAGNWYRQSLTELFDPARQPYLWLCLLGAIAAALVFRAIVGNAHGRGKS